MPPRCDRCGRVDVALRSRLGVGGVALAGAALLRSLAVPIAKAEEVSLGDIKRTNLLRNDLSAPGREVIQVLVEFGPGVEAARHSHPGEELVYVTEGALEYRLEG